MFDTIYILTEEYYQELYGDSFGITDLGDRVAALSLGFDLIVDTFLVREFYRQDCNMRIIFDQAIKAECIREEHIALKPLFRERSRLVEPFCEIQEKLGCYDNHLIML